MFTTRGMIIPDFMIICVKASFWANDSFIDKKRGRHDNERTELRLRDLGKIWVLALAPRRPAAASSTLFFVIVFCHGDFARGGLFQRRANGLFVMLVLLYSALKKAPPQSVEGPAASRPQGVT